MAATETALTDGNRLSGQLGGKLLLVAGIAAVVAVMVVFWLWSQQPDYRVLFSNFADKDGGAVVAALEKMNVPYKFSDGGTAILVPAAEVHQVRLKLAAEGLPRGGNIGFELLENQKFGVSQFVEQVNFQRAMEGELEKTIQSIGAVAGARIHLAIPKPSVFVRDQEKPTASVLLNLRSGRTLDAQQVSAIVHLVASSVPNLPIANVTIVDQNGNLLSDTSKKKGNLDPAQLKYVEDLQQSIARRIESIISPIVGARNVRAEASAEIDFSTLEQAAEQYRPNQKPEEIAIRSMQSNESQSTGPATTGGVPGALSNQPPAPATAPINQPPAANAAAESSASGPASSQKNVTTNYELDKTVRYTQQPMGGIKRLTVAVVVNNIPVVDKKGGVTFRPLTAAEKTQVNDLAMQAMGFNKERGDSLTVVNSPFATEPTEPLADIPLWKQPNVIEYTKDALRFLVGIVVLMMFYKKLIKPMFEKLVHTPPVISAEEKLALTEGQSSSDGNMQGGEASATGNVPALAPPAYENNLETVKQLVKDNPKMVASMVGNWAAKS